MLLENIDHLAETLIYQIKLSDIDRRKKIIYCI